MFGDPDRFAAMKINMFGQMSNMNYVGPSFTCPDEVKKEFRIGKTKNDRGVLTTVPF